MGPRAACARACLSVALVAFAGAAVAQAISPAAPLPAGSAAPAGSASPVVPSSTPTPLMPDTGASSILSVPARGAQSDPRQASTAAEQAGRLMRERKNEDALRVLDVALKTSPRDPQLRFLYGVALADLGRTQDATAIFEQMTQDFPELPEPHNNLAVMHAAAGELDKARAALENAVRALPGYALAQENLGDVYLRMAARAYERATTLDPRSESARERLALAREFMRRTAQTRPNQP